MSDERERLTLNKIKQDLSHDAYHSRQMYILICFMFLVFTSLPILIFASLWHRNTFEYVIAVSLGMFIPVVIAVIGICDVTSKLRFVKKENFHVEEDELRQICEDEFTMLKRSRSEDAFYFNRNGRVVVSKKACGLSMVGDKFYLVINDRNNKIVAMYNSKFYKPDGI